MKWLMLLLGGLAEIIWAFGLKMTDGFTNLGWSFFTVLFIIISFALFAFSVKQIPISTAYAVFTGIGAAGAAIIGFYFLREEMDIYKVISLVSLIIGIVGLKLTDKNTNKN